MDLDLTNLTEEQLEEHRLAVRAEQERRYTLRHAPSQIEEIANQYRRALGRETGAAWEQPLGAHDAYTEGSIVTHDGQQWRSTIPANVWEPGVGPGWVVDEDAEPEPQPDAPAWAPGVEYEVGDLVDYQGTVYRVLQAHTSAAHWTPDAVASLYVIA